ncbi:hypothetical protein V6N13_061955 [Hibiscus sabdariffa]
MVNRFPQHGYWLLSMNTRHLQKEYLADQSLHSPVQQSTLLAHKWRPPTADTVKVNFDKAFDPNIGKGYCSCCGQGQYGTSTCMLFEMHYRGG